MVDNDAVKSLWEASIEGSRHRPIKVWNKALSSVAELLTIQKAAAVMLLGFGTDLDADHGTSSTYVTGAAHCELSIGRLSKSCGQAGTEARW